MQNGPALIDGSPENAAGQAGCDIRLTLPAHAGSVVLVRHVLGGFTEALGLTPGLVEDVKLAVTEACTNVVRHAYDPPGGTLHVRARTAGAVLEVEIADRGRGLRPRPHLNDPGLGLPLMAALSQTLQIDAGAGSGSRVLLSFSLEGE